MKTTDVYLGWLTLIPLLWPLVLGAAWVVFGLSVVLGYHVRLIFHCFLTRFREGIELKWD